MKKALIVIGKAMLWIISIYILTLANVILFIYIVKPKPELPMSIIPLLLLAIAEGYLIRHMWRKIIG